MALETGVTYIEDLVDTNPVGATDYIDEGDDHIRNIKTAIQGSFPNLGAAAVTKTAAEINDIPTTLLNQKVIEIGDWNMDSTANVLVAHGVSWDKIRSISGIIRNDADTFRYPLDYSITAPAGRCLLDSTYLRIARTPSGTFDSTDFDSTGYNRGWITIQYTD